MRLENYCWCRSVGNHGNVSAQLYRYQIIKSKPVGIIADRFPIEGDSPKTYRLLQRKRWPSCQKKWTAQTRPIRLGLQTGHWCSHHTILPPAACKLSLKSWYGRFQTTCVQQSLNKFAKYCPCWKADFMHFKLISDFGLLALTMGLNCETRINYSAAVISANAGYCSCNRSKCNWQFCRPYNMDLMRWPWLSKNVAELC